MMLTVWWCFWSEGRMIGVKVIDSDEDDMVMKGDAMKKRRDDGDD